MSTSLDNMSAARAIGLFYGIILVILLCVSTLFQFSPTLAMWALVALIGVYIYGSLLFHTHSQASMIHKCLKLSQSENVTRLQLLVSLLFIPSYPFLGLPLVALSAIQLVRGKCEL